MKTLYIQPAIETAEAPLVHLMAASQGDVVTSTFGDAESHPDWYSDEKNADETDGSLVSESRAKGAILWE